MMIERIIIIKHQIIWGSKNDKIMLREKQHHLHQTYDDSPKNYLPIVWQSFI